MHRIVPLRHLPLSKTTGGQQCPPAVSPLFCRLSLLSEPQRVNSSSAAVAKTPTVTEADNANISVERKARIRNISKCLELYLDSLRAHEKMIKRETAEFELGKRHLANIMGWPSDMKITQDDIDRAIPYLFPTGLTDPKAKPVMKPPEEILPKFKKMDFDENGRPKDALFYTLTPKFYNLLSQVHKQTLNLVRMHDKQLLNRGKNKTANLPTEGESKLVLTGSVWMSKEVLTKRLLDDEKIDDDMYASLMLALEYLVEHPLSYKCSDLIMSVREHLTGDSKTVDVLNRPIFGAKVPVVQLDINSNRHFAVGYGKVKRVLAEVRVVDGGTGDYTINGYHYSEIRPLLSREVLLCPLIVTDLLGKVDIHATILEHVHGGTMLIPRAVRHGASLALAALYPEHRETLRLAGLLTYDPRRKERSKVNQPGARAKWIWKKR